MIKTSDIVNKVFSRSFMGYDMREVDAFFDDIIEQFEAYETEKKELLLAMEQLLAELESMERTGVASPMRRKPSMLTKPETAQPQIGDTRMAPPKNIKQTAVRRSEPVSLEIETGTAAPPKRIAQQEMNQAAAAQAAEVAYEEESDVL